jgi:hypothetical protein
MTTAHPIEQDTFLELIADKVAVLRRDGWPIKYQCDTKDIGHFVMGDYRNHTGEHQANLHVIADLALMLTELDAIPREEAA